MNSHIANKIEAKDKKLSEILFNKRYEIEYFQREYRWQRRHVEELISDLTGSFFTNFEWGHDLEDEASYNRYYLGPIVVYQKKSSLSIVDGQQRLTSLTLLLLHLNHLQNTIIEDEELHKDLKLFLFYKKGKKETLILDVETRSDVILHLYEHPTDPYEYTETARKDESVPNLLSRYEDIETLFPEELKDAEVLPIFIEWLLDKVVMVEIRAFSSQNAYSIFETMNDRGLNLTPTEMLKSYLLAKAEDEEKIKELNDLWREIMLSLKTENGVDSDQDFFKAWLRAKYAEKIRKTSLGAENEDFENIGTRFHTWVRENEKRLGLAEPQDFYFFVKSDIDFFSNTYQAVATLQEKPHEEAEEIYIRSFYKIADSLSYPLYLSPITKLDDEGDQLQKIKLVSWFIDNYTTSRTILGKSITQSSIRNAMYELIKSVRNKGYDKLQEELTAELQKNAQDSSELFSATQSMNNWGYYHYFFARILYYFKQQNNEDLPDFVDLMRSKKQRSLVLYNFLYDQELNELEDEQFFERYHHAVASYCLIKRNETEDVDEMDVISRINWLHEKGYLPEMKGFNVNQPSDIPDFLIRRGESLSQVFSEIWSF